MGYDMKIIGGVEPTHPDVVKAASNAVEAVGILRSIKTAHGYMDTPLEFDVQYSFDKPLLAHWASLKSPETFRLNMWAMQFTRETMELTGMIHYSADPVTVSEWKSLPDPDEDWAAYLAAQDKITAKHVTRDPTIPSHKLSSNDGWNITPKEISWALASWDQYDRWARNDQRTEFMETITWRQWIDYLWLGFYNGGIRVS